MTVWLAIRQGNHILADQDIEEAEELARAKEETIVKLQAKQLSKEQLDIERRRKEAAERLGQKVTPIGGQKKERPKYR